MATPAHCAYCFETLTADLERREALSFLQVQRLWSHHQMLQQDEAAKDEDEDLDSDPEDNDSLLDALEEREDNEDEEVENEVEEGIVEREEDKEPQPTRSPRTMLQLPSISRLQGQSPGSASSSASTPSSLSATSSSAALGGNSKSSSTSSFFSFGRSKQPSPAATKPEEHPLFVTWNTVSPRSNHRSLRGCIGTFDAQDLATGLSSYALTAAFNDTRFHPVHSKELPTLSCSVTLLTNFTPCSQPLDWTLGTHGIRISFQHQNRRYGATYLPDVATEQGWTKEETIVSLMRKAGWIGRSKDWNGKDVKGMAVVRYEGAKATLGWDEWRRWRDWAQKLVALSRG